MKVTKSKKVMVVFGTRPEAIKMAPLVNALIETSTCEPLVVVTGQHRKMLDQVLELFSIVPHRDLALMQSGDSLPSLTARILQGMASVLSDIQPNLVLVHGDTTTAFATALACYYAKVPVGHVEAGLRSGNMFSPWPEEMNRRLIAPLCALHFAPTHQAKHNLLEEGISADTVYITGNTVIDALLITDGRLQREQELRAMAASAFPFLDPDKRLVLVTGHRRESFGKGFESICDALQSLAQRPDIQIVYPVHLNPNVLNLVKNRLGGISNIHLIEPQDYLSFVYLMRRAEIVLTDSGGIQEEAPALGKPVLVMREITERTEAIAAGTARLVGTDSERIVVAVNDLLADQRSYARMATAHNPYGDGAASRRIVDVIRTYLSPPLKSDFSSSIDSTS